MNPHLTSEGFLRPVSAETLHRFKARFGGHDGYYAEGYLKDAERNKYGYAKKLVAEQPVPLTDLQWLAHLQGEQVIGVYPINDAKQVRWFAVDVDGHGVSWDEIYATAQAQATRFRHEGLHCYVERSRSGFGAHVWGFLEGWLPASVVRRAVYPLLVDSDLIDRGKFYPADPARSEHGVLIGLPYQPEALERDCSTMLDQFGEPIALEAFLDLVRPNAAVLLEKLAAAAPNEATAKFLAPGRELTIVDGVAAEGRPTPLYRTGIYKLVSPYGCQFMHHVWKHHAEHHGPGKHVPEPMWYAALGQLSAFEHGESAARHISQTRMHEFYKWGNVRRHPPLSCQQVRQQFPEQACASCPVNTPFQRSQQPLTDMFRRTVGDIEHGQYDQDLARIKRRNSGQEDTGILTGLPALDKYLRFRRTELCAIGSQPSIGKSGMMVDLAATIGARNDCDVYPFSGESSRDVIHDRLIAHEALVDSIALRGERLSGPLTSEEYQRIEAAVERLKQMSIYENYATLEAEHMLRLIERNTVRQNRPWDRRKVILADYLQYGLILGAGEGAERRAIDDRLDGYKALQKVLEEFVGFFSQLIRSSEGKDEPALNWWRGSGKTEHIIDLGLILTGERIDGPVAPRTIHIVKQKEGRVGVSIDFMLRQQFCRFESKEQYKPAGDLLGGDPEPFGLWAKP